MRETGGPDRREPRAAHDRSGDGDGREARWAGLLHDAAYYAARAVAEGRLSPEALWPRSPAQAGAPR